MERDVAWRRLTLRWPPASSAPDGSLNGDLSDLSDSRVIVVTGMRTPTSAVLTLVAMLLASQASGFACLLGCGSPDAAAAVAAARPAPAGDAADGTCHRNVEREYASAGSIAAVPHDCGSHLAGASTLSASRSSSIDARVPQQDADAGACVVPSPRRARQTFSPDDPAPPRSGPRLIAPLRV